MKLVDSRLRRSPPDRVRRGPRWTSRGKRPAFPPPGPQVGGCPQASQHHRQHGMNLIPGKVKPSAGNQPELILPGSCPNNRNRRTLAGTAADRVLMTVGASPRVEDRPKPAIDVGTILDGTVSFVRHGRPHGANSAANGIEQKRSLAEFFDWYNRRRPHQALGWRTPDEAYLGQSVAATALAA